MTPGYVRAVQAVMATQLYIAADGVAVYPSQELAERIVQNVQAALADPS